MGCLLDHLHAQVQNSITSVIELMSLQNLNLICKLIVFGTQCYNFSTLYLCLSLWDHGLWHVTCLRAWSFNFLTRIIGVKPKNSCFNFFFFLLCTSWIETYGLQCTPQEGIWLPINRCKTKIMFMTTLKNDKSPIK